MLGELVHIASNSQADCFHGINILSGLLEKYANTEAPSNGNEARVLAFREQNKDNFSKVTSIALGHARTQNKNKLVMALVEVSGLAASNPDSFTYQVLRSLAALENSSFGAEGS